MRSHVWRISLDDYQKVQGMVSVEASERSPAYVFVVDRLDTKLRLDDLTEWFEGTGVEHTIRHFNLYRFIELYTEAEAVLFKLRWV